MIYRYRMTTGKKDGFFREYDIKSTQTLYDFHRFIQGDLDFDESQITFFYTCGTDWEKKKEYSLFDKGYGTIDTIRIEQIAQTPNVNLIYVFDSFNNRSFMLELIGEVDEVRRATYPLITDGKGNPPNQFEESNNVEEIVADNTLLDSDDEDFDDDELGDMFSEIEEDE